MQKLDVSLSVRMPDRFWDSDTTVEQLRSLPNALEMQVAQGDADVSILRAMLLRMEEVISEDALRTVRASRVRSARGSLLMLELPKSSILLTIEWLKP